MEDIKAFQGYMAAGMGKFQWLESFGLQEYKNKREPLVVFGCYKDRDCRVVMRHKGDVILIWMGTDTHKIDFDRLIGENIIHVTWLKPVQTYMVNEGIDCKMLKLPIKEYPYPTPMILGDKVYAYVSKGKPKYHGSETVNSLNIKYKLLIGNNSIRMSDWYGGMNNKFYSQAFIGLALSEYVGGAMSIQEMAVRGIRVVTNVLNLPNCIPWKDREDVERIINDEAKNIGRSNNQI